MGDLVITGASRGIGRALSMALRGRGRLILISRESDALRSLERELIARGDAVVVLPADLSSLSEARRVGALLAQTITSGATLIHNAGLWPTKKKLTADGLEESFALNCLSPLLLQAASMEKRLVSRVMMISAGLLIKGRFDPQRTPTGEDFSRIRTYCTTKLCGALAMRDFAEKQPELDVLVLHPGVVRTDLGAMSGALGWLLSLVKRSWESPDVCAARLARVVEKERWSSAGAAWMVEEKEQPWPEITNDQSTRDALREVISSLLTREK
jgi:short-subunit dehydrogenase